MVVKAAAWRQCVPEIPALAGVCGNSLSAKGEDVETLSYIRKAGYPIWYNPRMVIWHDVLKERLSRDYLFRLFPGHWAQPLPAANAELRTLATAWNESGPFLLRC